MVTIVSWGGGGGGGGIKAHFKFTWMVNVSLIILNLKFDEHINLDWKTNIWVNNGNANDCV